VREIPRTNGDIRHGCSLSYSAPNRTIDDFVGTVEQLVANPTGLDEATE
jgi:hypothetical protein